MARRSLTPERYVAYTRAALWSLTVIVVSGGAVRLTGSGLGCSDWPNCQDDQLVADLEYHSLIEFVNRLFTGVVTAAGVLAVLGSMRRTPRRRDLTWWSWGLVVGVVAQILLGALLVKTDLDPRYTIGHFLLSMVLLWNAAVLHHRAGHPVAGLWVATGTTARRVDPLAPLVRTVTAVGGILLITGTLVTGSGPHSGSDDPDVAARLPFEVRDVARIHSLTAIVMLLLVLETARRCHNAGRHTSRRRALIVAELLAVQGAVGYWQYFTGVPVLLVAVHLTLASFTWIAIVRLHLATLDVAATKVPVS